MDVVGSREARTGVEGFARDALGQAAFFRARGHGPYADLLEHAAALVLGGGPIARAVADDFAGRTFVAAYDRPLLVCAALRDSALGGDPELARVVGDGATAESLPRAMVERALAPGAPAHDLLRSRSVQTNEVSRAVAWRWPVGSVVAPGERVHLVDLGCSAGLNLVADRIPIGWTDAQGADLSLAARPIGERHGLDRAPVDVREPRARRWLRACVWPRDTVRLARLDAALTEMDRATRDAEVRLHAMDAAEMPAWLEALSARVGTDHVLAYQTIVAGYLPPAVRDAYERAMLAWTRRFAPRATWVELEEAPREDEAVPGALPAWIRAHRAGGTFLLARTDYHPSVVSVVAGGLEALAAAR